MSGRRLMMAGAGVDPTLLEHWPYDGNANGTIIPVNGTVNGAILAQDRFGDSNKAYNYDGAEDYIDFGDVSQFENDDFTLFIWLDHDRTGTNETLFSCQQQSAGGDGECGWFIRHDSSNMIALFINVGSGFESVTSTTTLGSAGTFPMVGVSKTGTDVLITKNGVDIGTGTLSASTVTYTTSGSKKTVSGARWNSSTASYAGDYDGTIDDTWIYSAGKTEAQHLAHYNSTKP